MTKKLDRFLIVGGIISSIAGFELSSDALIVIGGLSLGFYISRGEE